jgi:hypothetical protein
MAGFNPITEDDALIGEPVQFREAQPCHPVFAAGV